MAQHGLRESRVNSGPLLGELSSLNPLLIGDVLFIPQGYGYVPFIPDASGRAVPLAHRGTEQDSLNVMLTARTNRGVRLLALMSEPQLYARPFCKLSPMADTAGAHFARHLIRSQADITRYGRHIMNGPRHRVLESQQALLYRKIGTPNPRSDSLSNAKVITALCRRAPNLSPSFYMYVLCVCFVLIDELPVQAA